MDIETLRRYCLSLPYATEGIQWGSDLLFRIGGKMFAVVALELTPTNISFKCTPEEFAELTERQGIIPAPYMARNHWVMIESLDVLSRAELKRLIKDSYGMVAAKLPKKVQAQLGLIPKQTSARKS
jgi:predicted DNA-binding protein (MmcQ/YjbR family)